MKFTFATFCFFTMLLLQACGPGQKEQDIRRQAAKKQKVVLENQPAAPTASNIGKRTAEEMVAAGFKRYGIEKGMLIFRMDGALIGTENVYFDHWGWREGKYIQTAADIGPYDKKENKVQFLDGERRYEYDPASGKAYFFESKQVQKSADRYQTKDMTVVGDEMIKQMGGIIAGTSEIQGLTCEVWDIDPYKTELSMWKGITMGERSHPNNIPVARTCVSIDTTSEIPLEKMVLPAHIELVKAN
ncbi:MAG: hypothetical protein AAFZ15_00765 [Bacteroidota bacterium]